MRKIALAIAVGTAALLGGTAANADKAIKPDAAAVGTSQSSDFSAHRRHHHHGHRHHRHYGSYGYYAPRRVYYAPPAYYAPEPYYYGGEYSYGGPSLRLGLWGRTLRRAPPSRPSLELFEARSCRLPAALNITNRS